MGDFVGREREREREIEYQCVSFPFALILTTFALERPTQKKTREMIQTFFLTYETLNTLSYDILSYYDIFATFLSFCLA